MRVLFALMLLVIGGTAQAAPVTIDFEDAPVIPGGAAGSFDMPQGFSFNGGFFISITPQYAGFESPTGGDGEALIMLGTAPFFEMVNIAGNAFDLLSMDVHFDCGSPQFCGNDDWVITAYDEFDQIIIESSFSPDGFIGWSTLTFGSNWKNISRLRVEAEVGNEGSIAFADNIVLSIAPIPAEIEVQPDARFNALHPQHDGHFGPQGITALPDDPITVVVITQSTAVGDAVDLDATDIDTATLAFGPGGGAINPDSTPVFNQDVDSDGMNDAQFEFLTSDSGIGCSDVDASLSGALLTTGEGFLGTDAITTDCTAQCHN